MTLEVLLYRDRDGYSCARIDSISGRTYVRCRLLADTLAELAWLEGMARTVEASSDQQEREHQRRGI